MPVFCVSTLIPLCVMYCYIIVGSISQSPHHHFRLAADILKGITRKIPGTFLFLDTGFFFFPSFFRSPNNRCVVMVSCGAASVSLLSPSSKCSSQSCVYLEREFRLKRRLFSVVPWHDGMLWLEANRIGLAICSLLSLLRLSPGTRGVIMDFPSHSFSGLTPAYSFAEHF